MSNLKLRWRIFICGVFKASGLEHEGFVLQVLAPAATIGAAPECPAPLPRLAMNIKAFSCLVLAFHFDSAFSHDQGETNIDNEQRPGSVA